MVILTQDILRSIKGRKMKTIIAITIVTVIVFIIGTISYIFS